MFHQSGSKSNQSVSKMKKSYPPEFREKAVKMITELGYSVSEVARKLGCSTAAIHRWKDAATPLDPVVSQRMELGEQVQSAKIKM